MPSTTPRAALCVLLITALAPVTVAAQDAPRRLGRLMSLEAETPAVWIAGDRVWTPDGAAYLSACGPSGGCAPLLVDPAAPPTACAAPECPGSGVVYAVAREVAHVDDWPTDHDGFTREREALAAAAPALANRLSVHPESAERERERVEAERADSRERRRRAESVRWVSSFRDHDRWEYGARATIATLAEEHGSYAGGFAFLALTHQLDDDDSDESDEDATFLNAMLGDTLGAELRVHFLHRLDDGQAARWIAAVGISPVFANRFETSVVRLPTFLGTFMPELGVILREDHDTTWYAAWEVPVSILLNHDLAVDVAARVTVVDEWVELAADAPEDASDPWEAIISLDVGLRLL